MTPERLLDEAAVLLDRPSRSMRSYWQRGCACLTRLALEQGLRAYWERVSPTLVRCAVRHQLLALPVLASASAALLAWTAWQGLSRAMHHHAYELPPTHAELHSWHRDVAALLNELKRQGDRPGRKP